MRILCIGDSLTFGNVGYSYIPFLPKDIIPINKGRNGDTLFGVQKRLKKILQNPNFHYECIILGIGTNDSLLPYLKTVDFYWKLQMSLRCKLKNCIEEDTVFIREYSKLLKLIHASGIKTIVWGMPYLNLQEFPNTKLQMRNREIQRLCEAYGFDFIDVYNIQLEALLQEERCYSWRWSALLRILDGLFMTLFPPIKDIFAKKRGLLQSVDGAHFSSYTAKALALEIEKKLQKKPNS